MQNKEVSYSEIYDYGRLQRAAEKLHLEQTEETETRVMNIHNHLVWHSYISDQDPIADAILASVLMELLAENNLDVSDIPEELKYLASLVGKGGTTYGQ